MICHFTLPLGSLGATAGKSIAAGGATWTWPLSIVIPLGLLALLYATGLAKTAGGAKRRGASILLFAGGWASLLVALDSPIHQLGEQLFWIHMTQHEILVLVSAPLLAFSRPLGILFCALPWALRNLLGAFSKLHPVRVSASAIALLFPLGFCTDWLCGYGTRQLFSMLACRATSYTARSI